MGTVVSCAKRNDVQKAYVQPVHVRSEMDNEQRQELRVQFYLAVEILRRYDDADMFASCVLRMRNCHGSYPFSFESTSHQPLQLTDDMSLLHVAAGLGRLSCVQWLIQNQKMDPGLLSRYKQVTPFQLSKMYNSRQVQLYLQSLFSSGTEWIVETVTPRARASPRLLIHTPNVSPLLLPFNGDEKQIALHTFLNPLHVSPSTPSALSSMSN